MTKSLLGLSVYGLTILIGGLFILGLVFSFHPQWQFRNKNGGYDSADVPGAILLFGGGLLLYLVWRRVFFLTVYPDRLVLFYRFSRKPLYPTDISRISLSSRRKVLGNSAEVKMALMADYGKLIVDAPVKRRPISRAADAPEEFSGNHVLSLNGIILYGIVAGFIGMSILFFRQKPVLISLIALVPILPFTFALGAQLFYFRIEGDSLVVRNHIFRWYNKAYPLQDIDSVVFERIGKQSNALRIRTVDFRSRSFSAGSLRDKRWVEFAAALEKRGIPVRNELAGIGLPLTRDQQV